MLITVLTVKLHSDHSLVSLRDRCRQVGELFGLDSLQRTRLTTAVSEIGRNALQYSNGAVVTFLVGDTAGKPGTQMVRVQVVDKGPGLPASVWPQAVGVPGRAAGGLLGSQRLVDAFSVESQPGRGTSVLLDMHFPRDAPHLTLQAIHDRVDVLVRRRPQSPREELEQQNREMLHTLDELRGRQIELEQADLRKNEFVAMLAHELRNPLSAICMTVAVLQMKKSVSEQELGTYVATIGRQATQLTRLVNDLMDVSRMSRGKLELERVPIEVGALVMQAIEMTSAFIDAKHHRLAVSQTPDDVWVDVDVVRMKQVISNLVHNAVRYTPEGGLLEVRVEHDPDTVSISVIDNGIGIDAAMLPRIFDLFTQASSSLARDDAGLGIGLTIVQQLVRGHGGTVTASSRGDGQGSQFVVRLARTSAPTPPEPQDVPAVAPRGTGRCVLIVDDNADAARDIQEMLVLSGHSCDVAHDGVQGLTAGELKRPDMALIDVGLPLLDGFGVALGLRKRHGTGLRIVAMSGYSSPEMKARALREGFDDFWVKPVQMPALLDSLNALPDTDPRH